MLRNEAGGWMQIGFVFLNLSWGQFPVSALYVKVADSQMV